MHPLKGTQFSFLNKAPYLTSVTMVARDPVIPTTVEIVTVIYNGGVVFFNLQSLNNVKLLISW